MACSICKSDYHDKRRCPRNPAVIHKKEQTRKFYEFLATVGGFAMLAAIILVVSIVGGSIGCVYCMAKRNAITPSAASSSPARPAPRTPPAKSHR